MHRAPAWSCRALALACLLALAGGCSDDPQSPQDEETLGWTRVCGGFSTAALWGSAADDLFAVGRQGEILRYGPL